MINFFINFLRGNGQNSKALLLLSTMLVSVNLAICQAQDTGNVARDSLVLNMLPDVVNVTSYLAEVKYTDVNVIFANKLNDGLYDTHVYSADVLHVYRGIKSKKIKFVMFVEPNEEPQIDNGGALVALCQNKQGQLYWPGTGSQFTINASVRAWLNENKTTIMAEIPHTWCES